MENQETNIIPDQEQPLQENHDQEYQEIIEQQKQEIAKLKEQLAEAITDSTTGLERREGLYRNINYALEQWIGPDLALLREAQPEELPAIIERISQSESALYVMMGDVAFLSLYNSNGHQAGDELLRGIGQAARATGSPRPSLRPQDNEQERFIAFRHGGDEITALIQADTQEKAASIGEEFKQKVGLQKIDSGNNVLPRPKIDVGVSHVSEAVKAYKKIVQEYLPERGRPRVDLLIDSWVQIADRRSMLAKSLERIAELMHLRKNNPNLYQSMIGFLRKGAQNIPDEEIDVLIEEEQSGKDWRLTAVHYVLSESERTFEQDQLEKNRRQQIINDIADKPIIESHFQKPLVH